MKRIKNILCILAYTLFVVVPWSLALELSDLHLPMTRDEADTTLSKDYESALLWDGSMRRTWKLDNRTVFVDFSTVSNEGVLIAVIYDKPVSMKVGKADAEMLAAGKLDKTLMWAPPKDDEARIKVLEVFGLERAMRMVLSDKTMLFYETDKAKKKIVRVSLFLRMPSTNRWILQEIPQDAEHTAMGNQMTPERIKEIYADEERRRAIPLKSDMAANEGEQQVEQGGTPGKTTTTITIKVPRRGTPQDKTQGRDAVAATTALGTPRSGTSKSAKGVEKVKIKMDRGQKASEKMTFLVAPPDWLKKVGIENPTWWHYIGIAVVLLLLVIMMLRAISHASSSAARRRHFSEVINQGDQSPVRQRRR